MENEKSVVAPVEIPIEMLSPEAFGGIINEFILREGTDYGVQEISHEKKIEQIRRQIGKGDIKIIFDPSSESVTLMTKRDWLQLSKKTINKSGVDILKKLILVLSLLSFTITSHASPFELILDHSKSTMKDSVDSTGLWILGVGTIATVAAHQVDETNRNGWKDHQQMSVEAAKVGDFWGRGIPEILIIGSQIYLDPEKGVPSAEGIIIGNLSVEAIKITAARERPDKSENVSMPSGHTQSSFSLATSMTESYGWRVGLPFWGMGILTGLSRMADDKHWLSDVVAGATLGILFGRTGFRHHQIAPVLIIENQRIEGGAISFRFDFATG